MKVLLLSAAMAINAFPQTTTFRAKQGIIEKIWGFLKKPISTVTYSIGNGAVNAEGIALLDLYIATDRQSPAGLQWEMNYDTAAVDSLDVATGPASTAAGKDVTCAKVAPTTVRCLAVGMNTNLVANGAVARVAVHTKPGVVVLSTTISLAGVVTTTKRGTALISAIAPGGGVVTFPVALSNLACPVTEIEPNEQVECTVSLSRVAGADTIVDVLYDDASLSGPPSVIVLAGQSSVTVTVTGQ